MAPHQLNQNHLDELAVRRIGLHSGVGLESWHWHVEVWEKKERQGGLQTLQHSSADNMVVSFNTAALSGLCSEDQLELLDAVDRLRLQGLDHYVSLPQIIVCGDQSSGKSSVLEAISGVPFPVKSNLCTRFPTELVLRRTTKTSVTVSIVPHSSLGLSEQSRLAGFHEKLDSFNGFPALIEKAKAAMGISTHGKAFAKDLLRVEITGPNRPHLTIVDLPGLIHSETKQQSASDVELVQDVVTSYMKQPRSIILAVISAKNDFANQIVLKLARAADRSGIRTMGVITKPDTLQPGSESEYLYASLAKNNEVEFRLGWHVLRNLDSEKSQGESQLSARDSEETAFFTQGIWASLPSSMLGIDELRPKLSNVLIRQIARELPSLIQEIGHGLKSTQEKIKALGVPRIKPDEQRKELLAISQKFQLLVKSSVDGTYSEAFFENAKTERGYQQRIRAVVQNLNSEFSTVLANRGHYRSMQDEEDEPNSTEVEAISSELKAMGHPKDPQRITRSAYIEYTKTLMRRTRARELPGTFNPMVVADLFHEQSIPWESIVADHVKNAWNSANDFLHLVVDSIADPAIALALQTEVFEPALNKLIQDATNKTEELLNAHRTIHPITYSKEYSEKILDTWYQRRRESVTKIVGSFFNAPDLGPFVPIRQNDYNLNKLVDTLSKQDESDIESIAASEALDSMHAYYAVAMKRFVDDVSVEVIEEKLLAVLGDIFSPIKVFNMSPELVATIAGEAREIRAKRKKLTKQVDVLKKGSETCKRFIGRRLGDDDSSDFTDDEDDDEDVDEEDELPTPDEGKSS
ncbi:dynamin family protein [Xylariaceae sp. FL1019]|nr:dynamin family protein [Xylariaceae sp. FL1019]